MKKVIKQKVETIREQEDALVAKDKETAELKLHVEDIKRKLQRCQAEQKASAQDLSDARRQMEDDKRKLDNNQQVSVVMI